MWHRCQRDERETSLARYLGSQLGHVSLVKEEAKAALTALGAEVTQHGFGAKGVKGNLIYKYCHCYCLLLSVTVCYCLLLCR